MTRDAFGYGKLDQPEVLQALFHPRKETDPDLPPDVRGREITVAEGVSIGVRFHLAGEEAANILFFHGNGEIVADYDPVGPLYNDQGLSFLAVDYRGYGRSGGVPTATAMMQDAHVLFKEIRDWLKHEGRNGPLFVMGRSLGSACALDVAVSYEKDVAGLIIESGFAYTVALLTCLGVDTQSLGITEAQGFRNLEKIGHFPKPTLIIHGRYDQIIPAGSAELLQVHCPARSKEFHLIPGADHNTVMVCAGRYYFEIIKRFTNKVEGKRPKRSYRQRRKATS